MAEQNRDALKLLANATGWDYQTVKRWMFLVGINAGDSVELTRSLLNAIQAGAIVKNRFMADYEREVQKAFLDANVFGTGVTAYTKPDRKHVPDFQWLDPRGSPISPTGCLPR